MRSNNRPTRARRAKIVACPCGESTKTRSTTHTCDCGRQYRRRSSSGVRYDYVQGTGPEGDSDE